MGNTNDNAEIWDIYSVEEKCNSIILHFPLGHHLFVKSLSPTLFLRYHTDDPAFA